MKALEALNHLPASVRLTAMLGGGALRSEWDHTPVKDYDLFFESMEKWDAAVNAMREHPDFEESFNGSGPLYPMFVHEPTGLLFNLIALRFFDSVKALAESFDFLCCGFAARAFADPISGEGYEVHVVNGAIPDAALKVLRILNPQPHGRLTRRARHYIDDYGYTPNPDCAAAIQLGTFKGASLPTRDPMTYGG